MKVTEDKLALLLQWKKEGKKVSEIAQKLEISIPTYYNWMKLAESKTIKMNKHDVENLKSHYDEPLFPGGLTAVSSFKVDGIKRKISVYQLDRQNYVLDQFKTDDEYKAKIYELSLEVEDNARIFYFMNKERKLNHDYMEYMSKTRMFFQEDHQKKILLLKKLKKLSPIFETLNKKVYCQYVYFNQFINLTDKEIMQNETIIHNWIIMKENENHIIEEKMYCEDHYESSKKVEEGSTLAPKSAHQYDIYWYHFPDRASEDNPTGKHPCVVVSSDSRINSRLNEAIILPMTSNQKRQKYETSVAVDLFKNSFVLTNQMECVPQVKLSPTNYELDKNEVVELQRAILKNLGLDVETLWLELQELIDQKEETNKSISQKIIQLEELKKEIDRARGELSVTKSYLKNAQIELTKKKSKKRNKKY